MKTFVINCGSSSIKYKLYSMTHEIVLAQGLVERVGQHDALMHYEAKDKEPIKREIDAPDHTTAMKQVIDILVDPEVGVLESIKEILGVGHRVVHAGERYSESVLIDDEVISVIKDYFTLSPLHNPPNLAGIEAAMHAMPETPQVAVFDTAFLATLPERAWMYAVPMEWYEKHRVRKYGFHGTSHKYVTRKASAMLDIPVDKINLITCHLGNGCSMTAVENGRAVEHSMGMTPLAGLMMGTRSGDLDPAVPFYMMKTVGLTADEVDKALNKASGLLGVSGVSNDMRDLLSAADSGNERARLAVDLFRYRLIRYIGSYFAVLGRTDAIIMTGGIGENCYRTRAAVCKGLTAIGVELDEQVNQQTRGGKAGRITKDGARTPVWVVPTNEELMIAQDTAAIVQNGK